MVTYSFPTFKQRNMNINSQTLLIGASASFFTYATASYIALYIPYIDTNPTST
jgi:hypothetical protein